eukprot:33067-Pelagomonas_calceolata.AAC.2
MAALFKQLLDYLCYPNWSCPNKQSKQGTYKSIAVCRRTMAALFWCCSTIYVALTGAAQTSIQNRAFPKLQLIIHHSSP